MAKRSYFADKPLINVLKSKFLGKQTWICHLFLVFCWERKKEASLSNGARKPEQGDTRSKKKTGVDFEGKRAAFLGVLLGQHWEIQPAWYCRGWPFVCVALIYLTDIVELLRSLWLSSDPLMCSNLYHQPALAIGARCNDLRLGHRPALCGATTPELSPSSCSQGARYTRAWTNEVIVSFVTLFECWWWLPHWPWIGQSIMVADAMFVWSYRTSVLHVGINIPGIQASL